MKYKLVWNDDAKEVGEKTYKFGQWSAKCPFGTTEAVISYDREYGYDVTVRGLHDDFYVHHNWLTVVDFKDAKEWALLEMMGQARKFKEEFISAIQN